MSKRKVKALKPLASYESTLKIKRGSGLADDTYARITESLLISDAFKDLKPHVQMLYIFMREQEYGKRKPNRDYKECDSFYDKIKSEQCIYFPWHTAKTYCNRYTQNSNRLYQDINILIEHGFIEIILNGRSTRSNSIYKLSDKWQQWKPKPP